MSITQLEDEAALSRLVDLYARAVDRGDAALLTSLFTGDATLNFGAMFSGGRDAFVDMISGAMAEMRTHHFMGNRLYAIDGDTAEGEIYSINTHIIPGPDGAREYIAAGRYVDRYRRTPDGWRIAHRTRILDWTHEGAHEPGRAGNAGGKKEDDLSMRGFPLLAAVGKFPQF